VENFRQCLEALANRAGEVQLGDFSPVSSLEPPPLDTALVLSEGREENLPGEQKAGGGRTPDDDTGKKQAGDTKGPTRGTAEGDAFDVFLSSPTGKGGPPQQDYELPPLPNKRKASVSSISEQPSRRTRVFDSNLGYDG